MNIERLQRYLENAILAALYAYFATSHVNQAQLAKQWLIAVPVVAQETLLAIMFLLRRPSMLTSTIPEDWVAAIVGTFAPLLIRPGGMAFAYGAYAQLAGFAITMTALCSLNRSIGIVAANRGIKTAYAYRVVRHPMYAGHLLCLAGYLGTYPSMMNGLILGMTAVALMARIEAEERLLRNSATYAWYAQCVKWRLIPGVY